jgi:hypothetical protein
VGRLVIVIGRCLLRIDRDMRDYLLRLCDCR